MSVVVSIQSLLIGALCAAFAIMAGLLMSTWWTRRAERMKRKIPTRWPLVARPVANTRERIAWLWMTQAFFDHAVMIKMPVTRFTLPQSQELGQTWYQLLSNAYCTFTVVDAGGRVVGCVDVTSPLANSKRSQILKRSLLDQCGIGYVVVDPSSLPDIDEIRAEFLGAHAEQQRIHSLQRRAAVSAASNQLRASLSKQRLTRPSDRAPLSPDSELNSRLPSEFSTDDSHIVHSWQNNSFLTPLDSRQAGL